MPFGRGKRGCSKGKPCGFTCIERDKHCLVDFPALIKKNLKRVAGKVGLYRKKPSAPMVSGGRDPETIDAKTRISLAIRIAQTDPKSRVINGVVKEKDVNWKAAVGSGVNFVGGGEFGAFVTVPPDKLAQGLAKKFPRGIGVKGGEIGPEEEKALETVGKHGLGPQLIAGRTSSTLVKDSYGISSYTGVLAMSKVPGTPFYDVISPVKGNSPSDIYWSAAAKLHRIGVAHNDMHAGNLLVDGKGVGRFVDLGLAQVNVKAALVEALGTIGGGNWQFMELGLPPSKSERRVRENFRNVMGILARIGINKAEFKEIIGTEIRSPSEAYSQGAWSKISDKDAMRMINAFYKGV
jgi:hypothetical protein